MYIFTGFIGVGLISLSGGINDVSFEIGFLYALIASISYGIAVNMVEPLIQGLLQQEYRPETVDPIQMIAMLRDQENRRRNQPPTLLG